MSRPDCVPEKVQEAIFNELLGQPENQECADCDNKSPTWVSLDFGVFLCIRCSGVHRQLGPHITRVRSTKLDGWKKENIEIMAHTGNKVSNDYYEFKMPNGYRKPTSNHTMEQCRKFVDEKYVKKLFAPPKFPTPVEEFLSNREKGVIKQPTLHKEHSQPSEPLEKKMIIRKRSVSLEPHNIHEKQHHKQESKTETKNNHLVDLLSADDDFFGKKTSNDNFGDFGDFKKAEVVEPKKINFESFKKANSQQQQPQDLIDLSTQNNNQQQQYQQQQQFQQQQFQQHQQQQTSSNNSQPDFKMLYGQSSNNNTTLNTKSTNSAWDALDFHQTTQNTNQVYNNQMNQFNNNYNNMNRSFQNPGFNQVNYQYGNNMGNMAGNFGYNNQNNYGNNGFNNNNNNNMSYGYQNQFYGGNNNLGQNNNYISAPNKFF
jgi:stromal membrane-associated protein